VLNLELGDALRDTLHMTGTVADQRLLLRRRHRPEQVAGLLVIVIPVPVIVAVDRAGNLVR
jgi:hypothetical protein